jgi:hypothetical protein
LLTDQDKISNHHRGHSIDASYQVSVHLAMRFQGEETWQPHAILVSYWSISKKSSPLKLLSHMNRNLVESIYMYGRFCIKFPQSRIMSNLHRGPSINASYQVSVHLVKRFQRRRFKKIGQSETKIA